MSTIFCLDGDLLYGGGQDWLAVNQPRTILRTFLPSKFKFGFRFDGISD